MGKIIPKNEAIKYLRDSGEYSDEEIKIIFAYHKDHPIVEDTAGRYRWAKTIEWSVEFGNDPNQVAMDYYSGRLTQEEYMDYNRNIGYSLYGFWEVFWFNGRFDMEKYERDMIERKLENRNKLISEILSYDI